MKAAPLLAGALLLAAGCAQDRREAERDCQRRLDQAFAQVPPAGGGNIAGAFGDLRQRLVAFETDGCSERQRRDVATFARLSAGIAQAAGRMGATRTSLPQNPSMRERQALLEFTAMMEQFDRRRGALAAESARIEREAR